MLLTVTMQVLVFDLFPALIRFQIEEMQLQMHTCAYLSVKKDCCQIIVLRASTVTMKLKTRRSRPHKR